MAYPLRLGVIGLGDRWQRRYEPALRALPDRFVVRALCDEVYAQAAEEARKHHCEAMLGPTALLEREDIDALLLADVQWFGLWPVGVACHRRKPVLCCVPLTQDAAHVEAIQQEVLESGIPVLVEWLPHFTPASTRVRQLLDTEVGPARLVVATVFRCGWTGSGRRSSASDGVALERFDVALLDWCARLVGGEPVSVCVSETDSGLLSERWEFTNGKAVHLIQQALPRELLRTSVQIVAEKGTARVTLPRLVRWTAADGNHVHLLRRKRPIGQEVLERFYHAISEVGTTTPTLQDGCRVLRWLRTAQRSLAEGRPVDVGR
jgi:predicted dehydrogenase